MRVPMRRSAAVLILAAVLAACGSNPPPAPTSGTSASAGPASSTAAPSSQTPAERSLDKGPVDPALLATWQNQPALDPTSLGTVAEALGQALRKDVDAPGTYGAVVTEEETDLGNLETTALTQLLDKLKAAASSSPSSGIRLASYVPPRPAGPIRPAQGLLGQTYALSFLAIVFGISAFDPRTGDVPQQTVTFPANNSAGTSVEITLTGGSSGGVVSFTLTLNGSASRVDSGGNTVTTAGKSSMAYTINPCPDGGGGVTGKLDVADSETTFSPGRNTIGWNITGHADYAAQVDDQGELATTKTTGTWDEKVTRTATQSHESEIGLSTSSTVTGPTGATTDASMTVDTIDGTLTVSQAQGTVKLAVLFTEQTPLLMVLFARDVWQKGRCFEVRPDPKQADVDPNSQTAINVTVYHWVDKADVQLPVKATLSGPKQIDPSGQAVTSPATFTYTAAGPGTTGTVTYKVTSKRGISEATGTYTVRGNLIVGIFGKFTENSGGIWLVNLKVSATGIAVKAADDGTLTASGTVTLKGSAKGLIAPCTATVTETTGVQVRGQLQGPPDAQVYHLQFGPTSTNNVHTVVSCQHISVPATTGDYFGQWSTTLGYVDIPAAGGTVTLSGSVGGLAAKQASGTFTAKTK